MCRTSDDTVQSIAESLSQWTSQYSFEDLPEEVANEAKRCLVDMTGVAIAGSQHPIASLVRGQVASQYGAGPCSVIGGESPASPAGAALANGTSAHVLDFDDVSYEGMVHATAVVWPAVLAAAELVGASGRDALTAFVVAVEVEYALGRAFTHDLFWRGWWTTGLLGAIGAAVGAAKVMGLRLKRYVRLSVLRPAKQPAPTYWSVHLSNRSLVAVRQSLAYRPLFWLKVV